MRTPVAADAPAEEWKLATVVFADLVGSTELGDAATPSASACSSTASTTPWRRRSRPFVYLRGGRIVDAASLLEECRRLAAQLTPHDVVHAVGLRTALESAGGRWEALAELTTRVEAASEANEDAVPVQLALAPRLRTHLAHMGQEHEARRLEQQALARAVIAGPPEREPALLRLALVR